MFKDNLMVSNIFNGIILLYKMLYLKKKKFTLNGKLEKFYKCFIPNFRKRQSKGNNTYVSEVVMKYDQISDTC